MSDIILAKSPTSSGTQRFEETLPGHTRQVMQSFVILFGSESPTRLARKWLRFFKLGDDAWDAFFIHGLLACGLHDIGKANSSFQALVRRKSRIQVIRHEHLSGLLMMSHEIQGWINQFSGTNFVIILSAVIGHHLRTDKKDFASPGEDQKIFKIYPGAINEAIGEIGHFLPAPDVPGLSISDIWDFDGSTPVINPGIIRDEIKKKLDRLHRELKSNRMLMAVRAALLLADSSGSAMVREGIDLESWLNSAFGKTMEGADIQEKVIQPRVNEIEAKTGRPFTWSMFQNAAESLPSRALLISPCGSGKTLAAWRWIKGQLSHKPASRVIFLYPTRATATEGFKDYVSWAPEADAALVHGTASYDLEGVFQNPEDARHDKNFSTQDRLFALGYWHRRIFSATVDQFLGFMQQVYRSVCLLPLLADSVVVMDEVHSFDKSLFSALKSFLRNFDVPVLCMTASLPINRLNDLSQACGLKVFPEEQNLFADLEASAAMPRYQVHRLENADDAENVALKEFRTGKKVLWVVNTVNRCQTIAKTLNALCYHSRFRLHDRKRQHEQVIRAFGNGKGAVLAITTQVCEMSLDLDADVLIIEKAPVTSMIQRMGRCNRHARIGDDKLGQVYFYNPEDQTPYDSTQLTGADAFVNALDGQTVNQNHLQNLLEEYGPGDVEVEKYAAFLENGPWACSREESLRDENHFTINALLDDDIPEYFALRSLKKPIDGLLVPVPRRRASPHPKIGQFPLIASARHYHPEYGFFDFPLEEIL
jgi:CRISPR-associated endonuclease/helicase Cas3